MIGIDDDGGVFEFVARGSVPLAPLHDRLVMVIGDVVAVVVHPAAQHDVRVLVALGCHLPVVVHEHLRALGCEHRIEGNGDASARRVFDAHGQLDAAGDKAVELVLARTRPHGDIGQKVLNVCVIFGIEHLVRGGETRLLDGVDVQIADGEDAL